jgi:hypothetical protein
MSKRFPGVDIFDPGNDIPAVSPSNFNPNSNSLAMVVYSVCNNGKLLQSQLSHQELISRIVANNDSLGRDGGSVFVSCLQLNSEAGIFKFVLPALLAQCEGVFMSPCMTKRRPLKWLESLSQCAATDAFAPSHVFDLCSQLGFAHGKDLTLGNLKNCITEYANINSEIGKSFFRRFNAVGLKPSVMNQIRAKGVSLHGSSIDLAAGVVSSSVLKS